MHCLKKRRRSGSFQRKESFDLTYLSCRSLDSGQDGVGTLPGCVDPDLIRMLHKRGAGCQGFNGPYPSAFLDK
jgi:hypothetical protein